MEKNNELWKDKLTPEQYNVARLKGTERVTIDIYLRKIRFSI